jgi:hypothetical protein
VGQLFLGAPNWEEQAHGKSRSPLGVQNKRPQQLQSRVNFANEMCPIQLACNKINSNIVID